MDWRESAKRLAAVEAVKHVKNRSALGLGSGTTVAYALKEIGRRIAEEKLQVSGVPTSHQTLSLALQHKIPLTTLHEHPQLDMTLDGADQVDEELNMIKGMGGALTREKIVASTSKTNVIIVDETKLTKKLGTNHPVPIEVLPFALPVVEAKLSALGGRPDLRDAERKLGPVVTDNGNFILDVDFGPIESSKELNEALKAIPGIVETGLFNDMANTVYVGGRDSVRKYER